MCSLNPKIRYFSSLTSSGRCSLLPNQRWITAHTSTCDAELQASSEWSNTQSNDSFCIDHIDCLEQLEHQVVQPSLTRMDLLFERPQPMSQLKDLYTLLLERICSTNHFIRHWYGILVNEECITRLSETITGRAWSLTCTVLLRTTVSTPAWVLNININDRLNCFHWFIPCKSFLWAYTAHYKEASHETKGV